MKDARNQAQMALTLQVAERLDGELKQLTVVASTIQTALAQGLDFQEGQLESWLKDHLEKHDHIHGITLAYAKGKGPNKKQDYCLYVYRNLKSPKELQALDLALLKNYSPPYREWHWFSNQLEKKNPHWLGPCFDGGPLEEFWMISYSLPIYRKQECVGVLVVDLRMDYFARLLGWLQELNVGDNSYGFVVNGEGIRDGRGKDKTGAFVSHPKFGAGARDDQPPKIINKLDDVDSAFSELAHSILKLEKGRGTAIDPYTKNRSIFLFARVPSTRWTFVMVIPE